MAQKLIQEQAERQQLQQRLTAQQMLQVRLLEMPLTQLEQSVNAELDDNPALESMSPEDAFEENGEHEREEREGEESFEEQTEREEREDALDAALDSIGKDDQMPEYDKNIRASQGAEYEEIVYGDTVSFYHKLKEQMGEQVLTEMQREVMEYLIGSLDDDGLLRKDLESISDELAIYHNIDASTEQIAEVLHILQEFDPPGVGARSLRECLLLQVDRKPDSRQKELLRCVIADHFEEFIKKHWNKIQSALSLTDDQMSALQAEILRLNPKPGASLGETQGRNMQQITPDFIVDTADDGSVSFSLNRGNLPELYVSPSFSDMLKAYQDNKKGMSRQEKEALLYAVEKVSKAQGFIDAIKKRRQTMYLTMKAIIDLQRPFFRDGDETEIRPMILKDVADRTGLDISTISRVSNVKYAQTRWGTFPLRFFFSDSYTTEDGEEMSTRKIKMALKELIGQEDKGSPLSDESLMNEMKKRGYPIARRTIAKYREQMGIPVARLRKG